MRGTQRAPVVGARRGLRAGEWVNHSKSAGGGPRWRPPGPFDQAQGVRLRLRSDPLGKVEVTAFQPLVDQLRQAVDGGVVATEQVIEGLRGPHEPEPYEPASERFDGEAMPVPEAVDLDVDANDELLF